VASWGGKDIQQDDDIHDQHGGEKANEVYHFQEFVYKLDVPAMAFAVVDAAPQKGVSGRDFLPLLEQWCVRMGTRSWSHSSDSTSQPLPRKSTCND
jgi:hypothetical protein